MLFLDTYALIEIIRGNPNYAFYLDKELITTKLNLMELYYYLLREYSGIIADHYYNFYLGICMPIYDSSIKDAMKFKLKYKSRGVSYVDCVGYTISLHQSIKFLTGDNQFNGLPNVEFIK